MTRFLLFTLFGPIAACGEIAVGERRMGWSRPARSAVLGLVAAALGIERGNADDLAALESGYGYAVRTDNPGRPFVDYHTVQVAPQRRNRRFETRRAELSSDPVGTLLSFREYRSEALYTAALWARPGASRGLDRLAAALECPRFTLYFGRKSAPFGLPLAPAVIDAESLEQALLQRPWPVCLPAAETGGSATVAFDLDAPGMTADRIERRRDGVVGRQPWQFQIREEGIASLPVTTGSS